MALLDKSGIEDGQIIIPSHVTNIYDALNTSGSFSIQASGSFSGSFVGTLTGTASYATFAVSASHEITKEVSSSFADLAAGLTLQPSIFVTDITASSNISASGTIVGSNLSGTNTGDQNILNLAITGSSVLFTNITASGNISSSGTIIAEDGNISDNLTVGGDLDVADTIYHTGDSNTKIRFPENDTISFHTSGVERLNISPGGHITASGNISASGNIIGELTGIGGAVTGINSILKTDLKLGESDETKIDFETTEEIHFYTAGEHQVKIIDNVFTPQTDSDVDLGATSTRWKDAYIDTINTTNITASGNISSSGTITGDFLSVGGVARITSQVGNVSVLETGFNVSGGPMTASSAFSQGHSRANTATGEGSHAEGSGSSALGDWSHAEGRATTATAAYSHAEGLGSNTIGTYSHAEGRSTTAYGTYSHAEGRETLASGSYSHAQGHFSTSSGNYSHAGGLSTVAAANYQYAIGQYNIASAIESALIVGNGADVDNRSDILFAGGESIILNKPITASGDISSSGDVQGDSLTTNQYVQHNGDTDTKINFLDDEIRFEAGNLLLFDIHKKGSAPHEVTVNEGGNNVDFIIEDDGGNIYFIADASTTKVGIGEGNNTPSATLHVSGTGYVNTYVEGDITASSTIVSYNNFLLKDGNDAGDNLVDILASSDDGLIRIYQNGSVNARIHGNGTSYFDGGNVGIGTGATVGEALTVHGNVSASITSTASFGTYIGDGSQLTNLQRPITTIGTNPFTASADYAGHYLRVGGNVTCSILIAISASCAIGTEFEFFQTSSAGYLLFETGSNGVTLNSKSGKMKLAGQFSGATLKKVGSDEWDLIGDLG